MPKAYDKDLRVRVVDAYRSGQKAKEVAEIFNVSVQCVYRWDEIEKTTGDLKPLYKAGDRSKITDDDKFLEFAKAHAHGTLSQMAKAWEGGISVFAISRKLKKLGITRKKKLLDTAKETKGSESYS